MRVIGFVLTALASVLAAVAEPPPGWTTVDYGAIVDRRQATHSGEPVGVLLDRLDGRPAPSGAERPDDRLAHTLVDPWLEPYGFVLSDTIDALGAAPERPWIDVAGLWVEGAKQPAWVEVLRSRRWIVESDGAGRLRAFVPAAPEDLGVPSREAARRAWVVAWPVLRHVVAAERRRLSDDVAIEIRVHPFVHRPARTRFELGVDPWTTSPSGPAPAIPGVPLSLRSLAAFLDSGLRLEGARLAEDGRLHLFGSPVDRPAEISGTATTLADLAVAYRAVFHGGMAEPYMSLDRGRNPATATVNYGGRLRDTRLGEVALRTDVRFKTFSLGLDPVRRMDERDRIRAALPTFRTHLERFASDATAAAVRTQQTRLWFYPDRVDLTISSQGDVLALRRVRMSAASERVSVGGTALPGGDPPWTTATVDAINRNYDALAKLFPELGELDQCVRLLSLFTWLRHARSVGLATPDLDALMALELPEYYTPRRFPQLLTYSAVPPVEGDADVVVLDRMEVGTAIERLDPSVFEPLPARERFERAIAGLSSADADHRALAKEVAGLDAGALDDIRLDALAYRAERLAMHRSVLSTLSEDDRATIRKKVDDGELARAFSVAIGGLDLGMTAAVRRATSRSTRLATPGAVRSEVAPVAGAAVETSAPEPTPGAVMPDHGADRTWETGFAERAESEDGAIVDRVVSDVDGPGVRSREVRYPGTGGGPRFHRVDGGRIQTYDMVAGRGAVRATPVRRIRVSAVAAPSVAVVEGTAVLSLDRRDPGGGVSVESLRIVIAMPDGRELGARYTGAALRRVVGGPVRVSRRSVVPGLVPAPEVLADVERVVVPMRPERTLPPWNRPAQAIAPEENPVAVARGLRDWWGSTDPPGPPIAVGATTHAAERWAEAPVADRRAVLIVPDDASDPGVGDGWPRSRVSDRLPARKVPSLVVLVSAEPPSILARRLRRLAVDPRMQDRLLAVYALAGPIRADLPAGLLGEGKLAGIGIAEISPVGRPRAAAEIDALGVALSDANRGARVEDLPGSLLWYF